MSEVSQEEIRAAMERYPGIPAPLAVSKYMLDKVAESSPVGKLRPGLMWGGVHLERVGANVQLLAEAMYEQRKKAIAIILTATDFPESWDHFELAVKDVDSGTEEEIQMMGLAGWPCCSCDETIKGDDTQAEAIILNKQAKWRYPTWGNVLYGSEGAAIATRCGRCSKEGRQPIYAVKKVDGAEDVYDNRFERVTLSELEDI